MKVATKSLEQGLKSPRESGDPWSPPTVRFSLPDYTVLGLTHATNNFCHALKSVRKDPARFSHLANYSKHGSFNSTTHRNPKKFEGPSLLNLDGIGVMEAININAFLVCF